MMAGTTSQSVVVSIPLILVSMSSWGMQVEWSGGDWEGSGGWEVRGGWEGSGVGVEILLLASFAFIFLSFILSTFFKYFLANSVNLLELAGSRSFSFSFIR